MIATIYEVTEEQLGSTTAAAALIDDEWLIVNSVDDFSEQGGSLLVLGQLVLYTAIDPLTHQVFLLDPLDINVPVDTPLRPQPQGTVKTALVKSQFSTEDGLFANVPQNLYDKVKSGVRREEDREVVTLEIVNGRWTITDILNRAASVEYQYVTPSTDGVAPVTAPSVDALAGINSIFVVWTKVTNPDPVLYDVAMSTSSGTLPDSAPQYPGVSGLTIVVSSFPDGTPVSTSAPTYFWVRAVDDDGAGPWSTIASTTALEGVDLTGLEAELADLDTRLDGLEVDLDDLDLALTDLDSDLAAAQADVLVLEGKFPITAPDIATDAIESAKIKTGAVLTAKLADNAVETSKLAALAVTSAELGPGAVITAKIAANAVTTTEIVNDAINAAKIAAGQVGSSELAANSVIAGKIAAGTIVAADIAANTITASQIAALTITASQLAANTITASKIAADTITATEIAANAITTSELNALAVTAGKIAANTITAGQIAAGTITTTEIAANTITAADILASTITTTQIAANTILAADIAAGVITATEIAALTITGAQIAATTITASKIAANTITTNEILAGTILASDISANTITAAQIFAGTITATEIAANTITAAKIATGTITATQIAAGTITATQIAAGTISTAQLSATAIDGMTITGALIQTDTTGKRMVFDGPNDIIKFYSGASGETTNGALDAALFSGTLAAVSLYPSQTSGFPSAPRLDLVSGASSASSNAYLTAGIITLVAATQVALQGPTEVTTEGGFTSLRDGLHSACDKLYDGSAGTYTSGSLTGMPLSVDGSNVTADQRVLVVKFGGNALAWQNGIYKVTTPGSGSNGVWDRALDADGSALGSGTYDNLTGARTMILKGTTYKGSRWFTTWPLPGNGNFGAGGEMPWYKEKGIRADLPDVDWTDMTLINSWASYDGAGGSARVPQYCRINGVVYLRGVIKTGASNTAFWQAPAGFRMAVKSIYEGIWIVADSGGIASILHDAATGNMVAQNITGSVSGFCYLTGVFYRAES
jgi:hypothetical protein